MRWIFCFLIFWIVGCVGTPPKKQSKPTIQKEATLRERLEKVPSYEKAIFWINRGISMVRLANSAENQGEQIRYFKEGMTIFRKAIVLLEETQDHLDEKDQKAIEKHIEQVQNYIRECHRDKPAVLKKNKQQL